jgi:hypothetical protein
MRYRYAKPSEVKPTCRPDSERKHPRFHHQEVGAVGVPYQRFSSRLIDTIITGEPLNFDNMLLAACLIARYISEI